MNQFDFDKLEQSGPKADKAYTVAAKGLCLGCFQLGKPKPMKLCKEIKPRNLDEISWILSIDRPSILDVGLDKNFIRRRNGEEELKPIHEKLGNSLNETLGIWLWQEQTISAVQKLTGWNEEESEKLRYCISKKISSQMDALRPKFIQSCYDHSSINDKDSNEIFDVIKAAERYSFCKNHSHQYAAHAYKDLYVKANFPHIFFTANLRHSHKDSDKWENTRDLIYDARTFNIEFLPPSLSNLLETFSIIKVDNNYKIRVGFGNLRGLGKSQIKIVKTLCNIKSWKEFILRAFKKKEEDLLRKNVIEVLIKSGCLDFFNMSRDQLLYEYSVLYNMTPVELRYVEQRLKENGNDYFDLKDIIDKMLYDNIPIRGRSDKLRELIKDASLYKVLPSVRNSYYERDTIGVAVTERYTSEFDTSDCTDDCASFKLKNDHDQLIIPGIVESPMFARDKNSKEYMRFLLSDGFSGVNCLMFNNTFQQYNGSNLIEDGAIIKCFGRKNDDVFIVNKLECLS